MELERYDAVVIGSGFGGAVMAFRLSEAGRRVLVLERGRPWPPGSFPRTPHRARRGIWDPDAGQHGFLDVRSFEGVDAVVASGLGGGSLIYANVMLRKDPATFVDDGRESWPLTRAELDPHYDRVLAHQRPQPYPHEALTPKTRALRAAADELGLPFELPPLAISFATDGQAPGEPIRDQRPNLHGRTRLTCRLCGQCDVGCNEGAKNTLDFTYLTDAAELGAEIRCCCEARALTREGEGWVVGYDQHLTGRDGVAAHLLDPVEEPRRRVQADQVVVACGALGSTSLLLRNRAALPGISRALGTRFSTNGDLLSIVRDCRHEDGRPRYVEASVGPVITGAIRLDGGASPSGRELLVQDAGAPSLGDWAWSSLELPRNLAGLGHTAVRRLRARLRGRRETRVGSTLTAALGETRSAAVMPLLGMGRDEPTGRVTLHGDELGIDWHAADSRAFFDGLQDTFALVARTLGGRNGGALAQLSRLVTVHPLGGCPMSRDARDGVVDPWGNVFGHPGLVVADGAVMPGPVGANPSFTIAALADRFADRMIGA